jgi:hypothetical protein
VARKYDTIDNRLLNWLRENPAGATTVDAIAALAVACNTTQRHISRRFSLLEDKGALQCELRGTTRVCTVIPEKLPQILHKAPNARAWRKNIQAQIDQTTGAPAEPVKPLAPAPSIRAANSDEFLLAGGQMERIPSTWDTQPKRAIGPTTLLEQLAELD